VGKWRFYSTADDVTEEIVLNWPPSGTFVEKRIADPALRDLVATSQIMMMMNPPCQKEEGRKPSSKLLELESPPLDTKLLAEETFIPPNPPPKGGEIYQRSVKVSPSHCKSKGCPLCKERQRLRINREIVVSRMALLKQREFKDQEGGERGV